ncbi:MAG: DUF2318 domain-containing protein [Acidaminobacter sp.]|nr:DUF2318 domain-containing protein [Acidaminobacter sp.]
MWLIAIAVVLVAAIVLSGPVLSGFLKPASESKSQVETSTLREAIIEDGNLKFAVADVTEQVTLYPYEAGETYMEVIAVKDSSGTIKTALNTCQICYNSGQGYYEQDGSTVVCQNCGNVFNIDDIEVIKGGCNPIPVMPDVKTEDGEFITISDEFLTANAVYFEDWKR